MKKRFLLPVLVVMLCLMNLMMVFGTDVSAPSLVMDEADILTPEQEETLISDFQAASEKLGVEIMAATISSLDSQKADDVAQQKYEAYMQAKYGNQTKDGILLLLSMDESSWAVYAEGACQDAVTKDGMTMIESMALPSIADGKYEEGLSKYAQCVVVLVAQASTGTAFKAPFNVTSHLIMGLVIGLIIALIVTGSMKGQLSSVHMQRAASSYIKQNSLKVTNKNETFLYKKVEKTEKTNPNANNTVTANNTITANAGGKSASGKF